MTAAKVAKIEMNPVFKAANRSKCRYVVLKGGAGSGKSVNVARLLIARLSDPRNEGCNLLCIRKDKDANTDSTRAELIRAIHDIFGDDAEKVWYVPSQGKLTCNITGNVILFRGVKDERQREKLKSISVPKGKIELVWIEEATELMPAEFQIIDDRLRGELPPGHRYQLYLTLNPVSALHWIKARFFDREDPDVFTCTSTYRDNRFIDDAYRVQMEKMREIDPEHYQVYGRGAWGESGGNVLTNYRIEHCDQDITHYDAVSLGCDFGFNHANAILLLGWHDGDLYVLREHYKHDMTNPQIIADVDETGIFADAKKARVWMICDSAEPDRIKEFQRDGWRARPVDKGSGKATSAAIDWLKSRCIHIDESCPNTAAEMGAWMYQKDKATGKYTDEPVPVNDDAMAALRYGSEPFRIATGRKHVKIVR